MAGKAQVMSTVPVIGTVSPYAPGQRVDVSFFLNGRRIEHRSVKVQKAKGDSGSFRARIRIDGAGKYAASARHAPTARLGGDSSARKSWRVNFPSLHQGQCGDVVVGFKKAMRKLGYIANSGHCFGGKTARGVLAYRKVNDMARSSRAGKGLVKRAFAGHGEYEVRHPAAGHHLEAPLSKQVLVFAEGDKAKWVYPVSSGKPSTPTVTGHFTFIRTEPGYNSRGDVLLVLLLRRLRRPRLRIGPRLPGQPRVHPDLHRRPARDLRPDQLRRKHLRLLTGPARGGRLDL